MTGFRWHDGDLVADGLACRRGDRLIFRGLGCVLSAGGALVLTGVNGSGKSSLLRLLATLLIPAAGRVMWCGAPVADDLARYRASSHYVGHLDAIKPAFGVRETLEFWAGMRGSSEPRVDDALTAFGLDGIADWPCRWLSAGQRRRLALARLIAAPAPLWLLDEPTVSLDSDGERRLVAAIEAHRGVGGRIAVATHQPMALAEANVLAVDDFSTIPPGHGGPPDDPFAGI